MKVENTITPNDEVSTKIKQELEALHKNIGDRVPFSIVIARLRTLYRQHPQYFTNDIIDQINSYKKANLEKWKYKVEHDSSYYGYYKRNPNAAKSYSDFKFIICEDGTVIRRKV